MFFFSWAVNESDPWRFWWNTSGKLGRAEWKSENFFILGSKRISSFTVKVKPYFGCPQEEPSNFLLLISFIVIVHYKSSEDIKRTIVSSLRSLCHELNHVTMASGLNQSIIVFCPRAGLPLQTQQSPLYPLPSLPFRICIQPIYHDAVHHWYLLLSRTFFPFTIPSRAWVRKSRYWGEMLLSPIRCCYVTKSPLLAQWWTMYFTLAL